MPAAQVLVHGRHQLAQFGLDGGIVEQDEARPGEVVAVHQPVAAGVAGDALAALPDLAEHFGGRQHVAGLHVDVGGDGGHAQVVARAAAAALRFARQRVAGQRARAVEAALVHVVPGTVGDQPRRPFVVGPEGAFGLGLGAQRGGAGGVEIRQLLERLHADEQGLDMAPRAAFAVRLVQRHRLFEVRPRRLDGAQRHVDGAHVVVQRRAHDGVAAEPGVDLPRALVASPAAPAARAAGAPQRPANAPPHGR